MEAFRLIANYSGRGALRSVCVDPIELDQNDRLKVVQNWGQPYEGKASGSRCIGDIGIGS